jgi:hypothetical protein
MNFNELKNYMQQANIDFRCGDFALKALNKFINNEDIEAIYQVFEREQSEREAEDRFWLLTETYIIKISVIRANISFEKYFRSSIEKININFNMIEAAYKYYPNINSVSIWVQGFGQINFEKPLYVIANYKNFVDKLGIDENE